MPTTAGSPPSSIPYDHDIVGTSSGGKAVRVRTLPNDAIEVVDATPGNPWTWSANRLTQTAKSGFGVGAYLSGTSVDIFYVNPNALTISTRNCADIDGAPTVWGAAANFTTALSQQPNGCLPRIAVADSDVVFYTDSNSGQETIKYSMKVGGTWQAAVSWDLGNISMGISRPVEIPSFGSFYSTLSAVKLGTRDYLLVFYADQPRNYFDSGIWVLRIRNLEQTKAIWGELRPVYTTTTRPF